MVGQACLCRHPVLDRHHRKIGAVTLAGLRIDRQRPGRTVATTEVVDPDDEELPGVERLARTDEVVPPADVLRIVRIVAGDVVTTGKGMANQHGVGVLALSVP
jgi:hypothetical protein